VPVESFIYGTVEDYEHNHYKTIEIGTQTWMAQNLRSWIYSNGDSIKEVYRYNRNDILVNIYGLYYTWPAATHNNNIEMTQGACPVGWHLPSNAEWQKLLTESGGEAVAGVKLKSILSWDVPNGWADNGSGFSVPGAGVHQPVAEYPDLSERMGIQTFFWSSTFDQTYNNLSTAWAVTLTNSTSGAFSVPFYRTDMGFSVRCVKN
jgi:uncharacterized protein (TIGR02145 family)